MRNAWRARSAAHLDGITRYEDTGDYMLVSGNATKAYDPARVRLVERDLAYLRRAGRSHPIVVVLDRVESAQPEFEKKFLLHTVNEPIIRGPVAVAESNGGRLSCLTLLPRTARIERIGGPGREAWVNGANYPYPPTPRVTPQFTPGAWRVEVAPAEPRARDTFLHVLFVDDAGAPPVEAGSAELWHAHDTVGVRIGGWSVTFPIAAGGAAEVVRAK